MITYIIKIIASIIGAKGYERYIKKKVEEETFKKWLKEQK